MPRKNTASASKKTPINPRQAELAKITELVKTRGAGLCEVIEFVGWLPSQKPDVDSLLEMDLDGDIVWGNRAKAITENTPAVRVYVQPKTSPAAVRRILKKIITAIEEHGMPAEFVSYGELDLPPHIRQRLKTGRVFPESDASSEVDNAS
jgi:hypothetical protein